MVYEGVAVIIRPYIPEDRASVRRINYETAFLNKAHLFFEDREIVADALTKYYTDHEPGCCFVAESRGEVVGYIIGTMDIRRMHRVFAVSIFLPLFIKALARGVFFKLKTYKFLLNCLISLLKGEFRVPDFNTLYPSTFHLNVKDGFRGQKIGNKLIMRAAQLIYERNVCGVQFSTMSEEPKEFFLNFGFHVIYESRRTFLRYALGHDTPFYLFGMKV